MMYEESPLLSPTKDFIFKRIFGNEEGKVGLISLLNAILNGDPVVKDLKFLNTEIPKEEIYTKASRLDVEAKTDDGTIVNVEIQCVDTGDLDDRAITYESQLIGQYTRQGSNYKEPNVISIWIIHLMQILMKLLKNIGMENKTILYQKFHMMTMGK